MSPLPIAHPFEAALRRTSPRFAPSPVPWISSAIHSLVLASLLIAMVQACIGGPVARWSVAILYAIYDSALIIFTLWQTSYLSEPGEAVTDGGDATLTVIIACHNEAPVIENTIDRVLAQLRPGDRLLIADDGSTDDLGAVLQARYGEAMGAAGVLRWLPLARMGKAGALNQALAQVTTDLFATIDADTLIDAGALGALRAAFADPTLVAATGVLRPADSETGGFFGYFQRAEYVRNFLSRAAWGRIGGLLLLSGACAGYRTEAVRQAGGFDGTCTVEDYELTHRLLHYARLHGLIWRTGVLGEATATTMVPGSLRAFLHQRRRWFSGFLQTQWWYRHMAGNRAYGRVGTVMLPVKAIDTLQPWFGLISVGLLIWYGVHGNGAALRPVLYVIGGKLMLDLMAATLFVVLYNHWTGAPARLRYGTIWLATCWEPFLFQPLRHIGAAWGWVGLMAGDRRWMMRSDLCRVGE